MSKEYERGIEQASAIYKEVIREYVVENVKLRKNLNELLMIGSFNGSCRRDCRYRDDCLADRFGQPDCFVCQELQELGIEVQDASTT